MNNVVIARSVVDAWEAHDLQQAASLLADDFVLTGPTPVPLNKEQYLIFQSVHNDAFKDFNFNISDVKESGDTVSFGIAISGTQTGVYDVTRMGLPVPPIAPTGKFLHLPSERLTFTIRNGKIAACRADVKPEGGVVGILHGLGVQLPAPAH